MIVHQVDVGSGNGDGAYDGLTGYLASAYQFGAWTGPGITSHLAAASNGVTGVGIGTAASVLGIGAADSGVWRGETVTAGSVLITYTYAGDVDLNGYVDGGDYGAIDNWIQFPGTSGYANGDVNFDGVIDGADYGTLDNTIQLQGPPLEW